MIPSVLLDTCVLLWILTGDERITANRDLMDFMDGHQVYCSPLSIAEIGIKASLGKLSIPANYREAIEETGIKEWPMLARDAALLHNLPVHHKDPFDRMLIACAMDNNLIIVTADRVFAEYPVQVRLVS